MTLTQRKSQRQGQVLVSKVLYQSSLFIVRKHLWESQCSIKGEEINIPSKIMTVALASVGQLVGVPSCEPKACRFNSQSGHMPGLWIWSPVRVRREIDVSLSQWCVSHPLSPSLPISLKSISMSLLRVEKWK